MNFELMAPPQMHFQPPHGWEAPQMPAFNMGMQMPDLDSLFNSFAPQQKEAEPEKPACQVDEADNMDVLEFERQLFGGMYKSSIKGFYRSSVDIIPDECMGEWMSDSFTAMYAIIEKFDNDPFSVSIEETNKVADDIIAMVYKNVDVCQVETVYDNYNSWCNDNYEICQGNDDQFLQRMMDNGMDIISAGYDLFNVFMKADDCSTDQQTLDMLNSVYEDLMKVVSAMYGFDAKWNPNVEKIDFWFHTPIWKYSKAFEKE